MKYKDVKCKKCWDKGFATVFAGTRGSDDFGGEGYIEAPKINIQYCTCDKGRRMKNKALKV